MIPKASLTRDDVTSPPSARPAPAAPAISLLDASGNAAWDAYVDRNPRATLYHKSAWATLIGDLFGHQTWYFQAKDAAGDISGILPLVRLESRLFGDFMVSMPYVNYGGAVADDEATEQALITAAIDKARALGVSHVELRDCHARGGGFPVRTDKVVMALELPTGSDELAKRLGAKLRSQIKRPVREGASAAAGGAELLPEFYTVFARNMRDLGTPVYSRRFFEAICERFRGNASVHLVRVAGKPVAAGLLLRYRDRMEIPWASALREHNRIGVNMMLYWEALKCAIEAGATTFDFGRSTRDSGTYRFKAQWGAEPMQLYWHYWLREGDAPPALNPQNPKYRLAIAVWRRLPLPIANALGPAVVKNLP